LVARNAALVKKAGFDQVITVCNACTVSLRKGLEYLKKDDDLRARAIRRLAEEGLELPDALAVRHLIEVFMTDLPADRWTWVGAPPLPDWTVAAYAGCQFNRPWADVDDAEQPMLLDRFIERIGFKVVDHPARTWCCGAALGPLYPDARERLIRRILTAAQGADVLATKELGLNRLLIPIQRGR
jgi:succinate dehydrogenase / fumarate reductase cytochrome b subunit